MSVSSDTNGTGSSRSIHNFFQFSVGSHILSETDLTMQMWPNVKAHFNMINDDNFEAVHGLFLFGTEGGGDGGVLTTSWYLS